MMFQLWKRANAAAVEIGPLETQLLELLWDSGESSVSTVAERMDNRLAYTTVMTTLDRLYKKGFLKRRKQDRAYIYEHRFSKEQWVMRSTHEFIDGLLAGGNASGGLLASCLVDAVGNQDTALLDELERKIKAKRLELRNREGSK